MSKSGSITYGYNADGKRISKTINGTTYNYAYLGDQLTEMTWGSNKLHFTYDSIGPASVTYNGNRYFYLKNAQGDVTGLVNASGTQVVSYTYDPWGAPMSTDGTMAATLGAANPLRYRGYVYDSETGLYYLSSRYYNPVWGRFINADTAAVVAASPDKANWDKNLFAYCDNDPVNRKDDGGEFWEAIAIGFAAGFVGQYIGDVIGNISSGKTGIDIFKPSSSIGDYLASGVGGAIAATPGLNFIGTMAVGAFGSVSSDFFKGNLNNWKDVGESALRGGITNGIGYWVSKGMAALKVKQIENMPRADKKVYLRDNVYHSSQANVNINMQSFIKSSMSKKINIVEARLPIFQSGFYSTVTSTLVALF